MSSAVLERQSWLDGLSASHGLGAVDGRLRCHLDLISAYRRQRKPVGALHSEQQARIIGC